MKIIIILIGTIRSSHHYNGRSFWYTCTLVAGHDVLRWTIAVVPTRIIDAYVRAATISVSAFIYICQEKCLALYFV